MNLYAYTANDPVNLIDPMGLADVTYTCDKTRTDCMGSDGLHYDCSSGTCRESVTVTADRLPPPSSLPPGVSIQPAGGVPNGTPRDSGSPGSDPNGQPNGPCSINSNENGWGQWFAREGGYGTKAGAIVVAAGLGNPAADAVGGGAIALGLVSTGLGMALMSDAGNGRGAFVAGVDAIFGAQLPDVTAASPTDPVHAAAEYTANYLYGPDQCH